MAEKWEKEFETEAFYDNDANDYFHEWVDVGKLAGDPDLVELFRDWLDVGIGDNIPIIIHCRNGAILIERMEGK